jgi:tetratricopeptide (TPR) repeat protein
LKYAKNKTTDSYLQIQNSINEFKNISREFYQKAIKAVALNDREAAIEALKYAAKNYPANFDINFMLGKLFFEEKQYLPAVIYLKQARCIDRKSLDVLEKLSSALILLGDFTGAYCCLKRILPLVINNQKEYLEIIRNLKQLEESFDQYSHEGHEKWAETYYAENNYHFALFEYENCIIINNRLAEKFENRIAQIQSYINPEERIIKLCFEKGLAYHSTGDFRQSNKYFTKITTLAEESSSDYKYAKAKIVDV